MLLHRQVVQSCNAKAPKEVLLGKASHKTYVHSENVMGIQMKGRTVPLFMLVWEEVVETHNWMDLERDMVLDHLADKSPGPTRVWALSQQLKETGNALEAEQGGTRRGVQPQPR